MLALLQHQYSTLPLLVDESTCKDRVWIVTGSNNGLGLETARRLVSLGSARVIMGVRSPERGREALRDIESTTGVKGVGEVWPVDMADAASVVSFCARAERELPRLDGVIENAAGALGNWVVLGGPGKPGQPAMPPMEATLAVNVVGTFLMAVLLLPHLRDSGRRHGTQPVLDIVASDLGFMRGDVDIVRVKRDAIFDDFNDQKRWSMGGTDRYALSKLLEVFLVRHLAGLAPVEQTGVVINTLSPGLCVTGLVRYSDLKSKILVGGMRAVCGRSAEWGSRTLLSSLVAGKKSHGTFMAYAEIHEYVLPPGHWHDMSLVLTNVQRLCARVGYRQERTRVWQAALGPAGGDPRRDSARVRGACVGSQVGCLELNALSFAGYMGNNVAMYGQVVSSLCAYSSIVYASMCSAVSASSPSA